jgi:uncharacterized protein YbaP (TraB family)
MLTRVLIGTLVIAVAGGAIVISGQTQPAAQATQKPFLWRVEGPVPSYLYGTIHVPDRKVLALPGVVRRAFDVSDGVYTELPLDTATQLSIASRLMLPEGQDLRTVAGEELFGRVIRLISNAFGPNLPPGADQLLVASMLRLKPMMAMTQLMLVDYLPEMLAGQKALDSALYDMAVSAGKQVGGLETVDEQLAVMDALTVAEQVDALRSTVNRLEKPRPGETNSVRDLVDLYLRGDLDVLAAEINRQDPEFEALQKKFTAKLLDDRNVKMADRIAARIGEKPARTYLFAVGAAHYPGETGLLSLLGKKGLKVTRLGPADEARITRPER